LQSFFEISPLKKHHDLHLEKQTSFIFSNEGHGCSSKDGISKKDSTQAWQWAYFQGFTPHNP
jgi:hypothetical protein